MTEASVSMRRAEAEPSIGVIVVAFNSADVIVGCLDSLLAQEAGPPVIVVVDNASSDGTVPTLRAWAAGRTDAQGRPLMQERDLKDAAGSVPPSRMVLIHSGANRGFAGGVNIGLAALAATPEIEHFWVLNPDAYADPKASGAILAAAQATPGYGLMSGRVCYSEPPFNVQIDGGTINHWTGVTSNINHGQDSATAPWPNADQMEFVTGANMVASRRFYENVGPLREDYFLYYEEVDWALRRGALPIVVAPGFMVFHHAGTSIGSPTLTRIGSPFAFWFKYRSRRIFVSRFDPLALPVAAAYATAKSGQLMLRGAFPQAFALLRGFYGLPAPKSVRERFSPEAARIAFGKASR